MSDKICLIIGGGRGMGAATARGMHGRGYRLALMSPSKSCEALAAELGGFTDSLDLPQKYADWRANQDPHSELVAPADRRNTH